MLLRDGAKNLEIKVASETRKLSDFVKDKSNSLNDCVECFEHIINIGVGDTGWTGAKTLQREFDIRQLYIKYVGDKPTGTQKDGIAFAQVHDALRRDYDTTSLATCGNYGLAVALVAYLARINCKVFIPSSYHTERRREMKALDVEIILLDGSYEAVVKSSTA
jgi:threonine synthase